MRGNQLKKIKLKTKLDQKYSDFEIEEFVAEINDYKALLNSIGFKSYLKPNKVKDKTKNKKELKEKGKIKSNQKMGNKKEKVNHDAQG